MTQELETYQGIVVPESVLVKLEGEDKYGCVAGLDDRELADPDELERQAFKKEWEPILALPKPARRCGIRPSIDEDGKPDWGAFATVDFERYRGGLSSGQHKVEQLRGQLKDKLIMLAIVKERLPGNARLVLEYLRMGIIGLEHMANDDMLAAARLYLQARQLQKKLWAAQEASRRHKHREYGRWLESLG